MWSLALVENSLGELPFAWLLDLVPVWQVAVVSLPFDLGSFGKL